MSVRISELAGVELDYWLARADGLQARIVEAGTKINGARVSERACFALTPGYTDWWQSFHAYWGSVGPLVEREGINLDRDVDGYSEPHEPWYAGCGVFWDLGPTPVIAAARAFIKRKFNADEIPG